MNRTCRYCGVTKPATPEYYPKSPSCNFGITHKCKECTSADRQRLRGHVDDTTRHDVTMNTVNREYIRALAITVARKMHEEELIKAADKRRKAWETNQAVYS